MESLNLQDLHPQVVLLALLKIATTVTAFNENNQGREKNQPDEHLNGFSIEFLGGQLSFRLFGQDLERLHFNSDGTEGDPQLIAADKEFVYRLRAQDTAGYYFLYELNGEVINIYKNTHPNRNSRYFVISINDEPVGFCNAEFFSVITLTSRECEILNEHILPNAPINFNYIFCGIMIDEQYRNQGLGRFCMEILITHLKHTSQYGNHNLQTPNFHKVLLYQVHSNNTVSIRLAESLGMTISKTFGDPNRKYLFYELELEL